MSSASGARSPLTSHLVVLGQPAGTTTAAGYQIHHGRVALTATVTGAVTGARSLAGEAGLIRDALADGDLPGARRLLPNLCGRDPQHLDASSVTWPSWFRSSVRGSS
jgi:cobalamin biosynthesis protein CobD/CbiB